MAQFFSSLLDLMKSTVLDESLSTSTTREESTHYFIKQQNEKFTQNGRVMYAQATTGQL